MNPTRPWDPDFEQVLRDVLPRLPDLAGDTRLRDCGLDSLATIEVLLRLEDTYRVSIPDALLTADTFATPASLWRVLATVRAGLPGTAVAGSDR